MGLELGLGLRLGLELGLRPGLGLGLEAGAAHRRGPVRHRGRRLFRVRAKGQVWATSEVGARLRAEA